MGNVTLKFKPDKENENNKTKNNKKKATKKKKLLQVCWQRFLKVIFKLREFVILYIITVNILFMRE